jgi:LytS/YehU family sensor histidine kinase
MIKEIEFIKNYFFLLQIRHDAKLRLDIDLDEEMIKEILIVPCALQILIENAIKHNEFSSEAPLQIFIGANDKYLCVENSFRQKFGSINSTQIGVQNLNAQYMLFCKKNIIIDQTENTFTVKLPLIKAAEHRPQNSSLT